MTKNTYANNTERQVKHVSAHLSLELTVMSEGPIRNETIRLILILILLSFPR